jgi:hypothetical protein
MPGYLETGNLSLHAAHYCYMACDHLLCTLEFWTVEGYLDVKMLSMQMILSCGTDHDCRIEELLTLLVSSSEVWILKYVWLYETPKSQDCFSLVWWVDITIYFNVGFVLRQLLWDDVTMVCKDNDASVLRTSRMGVNCWNMLDSFGYPVWSFDIL